MKSEHETLKQTMEKEAPDALEVAAKEAAQRKKEATKYESLGKVVLTLFLIIIFI